MSATRLMFRSIWRPATSNPFATRSVHRPRIPQLPQQIKSIRHASFGRQPFSYQRFQASKHLLQKWAQHPYFFYHVSGIAGACGGVYIYNLEEVPISHRRRFNIVSESYEKQSGEQLYQQVMQEYGNKILPPSHPQSRMVQRVLDRLLPHSGLSYEGWEVHVIQDDIKNAFVIPGGKVFVFSGILEVCQDDQGLAAVLGHEIAHNVAHHAAEKMSSSFILLPLAYLLAITLGIGDFGITRMAVDLGFLRPNDRKQESEADYIGLLMMSEACYDPRAALGLWKRMLAEEHGHAPPQFISTHPSTNRRIENIQEWLPTAESKSQESGCGMTAGYADDFKSTFSRWT